MYKVELVLGVGFEASRVIWSGNNPPSTAWVAATLNELNPAPTDLIEVLETVDDGPEHGDLYLPHEVLLIWGGAGDLVQSERCSGRSLLDRFRTPNIAEFGHGLLPKHSDDEDF